MTEPKTKKTSKSTQSSRASSRSSERADAALNPQQNSPGSNLDNKQLQTAYDLKMKLALTDHITKNEHHAKLPKTVYILVFLLIAVLLIGFSFLNGLGNNTPDPTQFKGQLFIPEGSPSFTPPVLQLPADLSPTENAWHVSVPDQANLPGATEAIRLQKEAIIKYGLPLEVKNDLGMIFRLIPPGQFMMGSPLNEAHRTPTEFLHENSLDEAFYLEVTETTQSVWLEIMGENPSDSKDLKLPIQNISFNDALLFYQKINQKYRLESHTYTLPSETEWEYSARAGTNTPWAFGTDTQLAKFYAVTQYNTSFRYNHKLLKPNAWGLYNMHGSMNEITRSPFFLYQCEKDQFASTWDDEIYDGDQPEDLQFPRNNFKVKDRSQGRQTGLYFHDLNGDGIWSNGEIIWTEKDEFENTYTHGVDTLIWRGDYDQNKDIASLNGVTGSQAGLYYNDENNNFAWDAQEEIWRYNEWRRYKSGYYIVRGGGWANELKHCRSAIRFSHSHNDKGTYMGIRSVRRLKLSKLSNADQTTNRLAYEKFLSTPNQPKDTTQEKSNAPDKPQAEPTLNPASDTPKTTLESDDKVSEPQSSVEVKKEAVIDSQAPADNIKTQDALGTQDSPKEVKTEETIDLDGSTREELDLKEPARPKE